MTKHVLDVRLLYEPGGFPITDFDCCSTDNTATDVGRLKYKLFIDNSIYNMNLDGSIKDIEVNSIYNRTFLLKDWEYNIVKSMFNNKNMCLVYLKDSNEIIKYVADIIFHNLNNSKEHKVESIKL